MIFSKWTDLKRELHVRLNCGCEGFIKSIHFERDPLSSGFLFLLTKNDCDKVGSLQDNYAIGNGPCKTFFHSAMAETAMPAQVCPVPDWWKEYKSSQTAPEFKLP